MTKHYSHCTPLDSVSLEVWDIYPYLLLLYTIFNHYSVFHKQINFLENIKEYARLRKTAPHSNKKSISMSIKKNCFWNIIHRPNCIHWSDSLLREFKWINQKKKHFYSIIKLFRWITHTLKSYRGSKLDNPHPLVAQKLCLHDSTEICIIWHGYSWYPLNKLELECKLYQNSYARKKSKFKFLKKMPKL